MSFHELLGAVHVKIESQGCNDQNIPAGTCGVTKLEVNGVDKSRKQRGYNVVVVNEQTGKHCSKTLHTVETRIKELLFFFGSLNRFLIKWLMAAILTLSLQGS